MIPDAKPPIFPDWPEPDLGSLRDQPKNSWTWFCISIGSKTFYFNIEQSHLVDLFLFMHATNDGRWDTDPCRRKDSVELAASELSISGLQ
jgi:hypothetical protein